MKGIMAERYTQCDLLLGSLRWVSERDECRKKSFFKKYLSNRVNSGGIY